MDDSSQPSAPARRAATPPRPGTATALPADRGAEVVVLDGGTATALERSGHELDDALWSARLLIDDPDAIVAVHTAFLAVGAQVVTTASYQLAAESLLATGHDPASADRLLARSVELGHRAVTRHGRGGRRALVAASVGPFGAVLADGSEYRGHYGRTEDQLVDFHAPRVRSLMAAGPDVLACETIPSGLELQAFARVLAEATIPAYVSVTLGRDGTTTPEGQPLDEAFGPLLELDAVVAVGVNCCPPELVDAALATLAAVPLPLIAKPNAGDRYEPTSRTWVPADPHDGPGGPPVLDVGTDAWIAAGARLLGGCCGTGPDDLAALVGRVRTPTNDA